MRGIRGTAQPEQHKVGPRRPAAVKEDGERPTSTAAALSWAAAAAARMWAASIREHAACAARSAACTAEDGANEDVRLAIEGCWRVPDAHGRPGADAMGLVTGAMRRAAESMNRAAGGYERSSRLYGAAAAEAARAYRAFRRVGDAGYADILRHAAARSRKGRRDAARHAADALEMAGSLAHNAARMDACAAAWAAGEGGRGKMAVNMRELSLVLADTWEDAKRRRLESYMIAEKAAELERGTAKARRLAASAARMAADESAGADASGNGRGWTGDPEAERAAAARRRAAAAANRADAEHPLAGGDGSRTA